LENNLKSCAIRVCFHHFSPYAVQSLPR
jgi:hypothetical protein